MERCVVRKGFHIGQVASQSWECKVLRTALELTSHSCSQFPTHTQNQTTSPTEHVKMLVQETDISLPWITKPLSRVPHLRRLLEKWPFPQNTWALKWDSSESEGSGGGGADKQRSDMAIVIGMLVLRRILTKGIALARRWSMKSLKGRGRVWKQKDTKHWDSWGGGRAEGSAVNHPFLPHPA